MNNRWSIFVGTLLVAFTLSVVAWQCSSDNTEHRSEESLTASLIRGQVMSLTSDIIKRDGLGAPANGWCRRLELETPGNARIFIADLTGPTNYNKIGNYFFATYYLFPREVSVSLDPPTRLMPDRLTGITTESDQEILA